MLSRGLLPALVAAVFMIGATTVMAQSGAAGGVKQITRLGNPGTRLTPPIRDVAALQKIMSTKANQKALSRIIDEAGLTAITPQVMKAISDGAVQTSSVAPGTSIEWMALRRGGKPTIVRSAVWAGAKPFDAYLFSVDDGTTLYNFAIPKACGNLSLLSTGPSPKKQADDAAKAAEDNRRRAEEAAKAKAAEEAKRKAEEAARIEAERKAFEALPPACGVTAVPTKVKGGYDIAIDGTGATAGKKPAESMTVQIIGPDGQPVPVVYEGKSATELSMKTPFKGTVFVKKPKAGTYTLRVSTMTGSAKNTCEATAVVPEYDNFDWFADGAFGKQRRNYEVLPFAGAPSTIEGGFCDPMLGFKAGPMWWFNNYRASFAPAVGAAFMFGDLGDFEDIGDNEYNNFSLLVEAMVNYHFSERGAYIGTGLGWWDVFDGDHNTANWIVGFGIPVGAENARGNQMFVIGEARLFFDSPDGVDNNYQMWGGLRYIWR